MQRISINYDLKYQHKIFNYYKWSSCGKLINTKTGRVIRKILNGRSLGYCINGKFRSLTRLKKEVEKINQIKTPF